VSELRRWEITHGLLEELLAACYKDPIVQARLKGFIQGKTGDEAGAYRIELKAALVEVPPEEPNRQTRRAARNGRGAP
jgi:hypothetical protein